jgi:hypothetical protein
MEALLTPGNGTVYFCISIVSEGSFGVQKCRSKVQLSDPSLMSENHPQCQKSNWYAMIKPPEVKGAKLIFWEFSFNQSGAHD